MDEAGVAYALLGWPEDGPTLRLDHREFSYAGKFVMSSTGKAVAYGPEAGASDDPAAILAAAAFDLDRTDADTLKIRYLTVRDGARGDGLGAHLAVFVTTRAADRGFQRVAIGVNNPFSYEALYKAGFAWTGAESGLAELTLARPAGDPAERDPERYRDGLDVFRDRDGLSEAEWTFVDDRRGADPPALIPKPGS